MDYLTGKPSRLAGFLLWSLDNQRKVRIVLLIAWAVPLYWVFSQYMQKAPGESMILEAQVSKLDEMEKSLNQLNAFIKDQRVQVQQSQAVIASLQAKHHELKPLVDADEKVVKALLQAQQELSLARKMNEWLLAFAIGVLSSLTAAWMSRRKWLPTVGHGVVISSRPLTPEPSSL